MMRARLMRQLDRVLVTQLTQVIAPVGAGKSSLVASWVADRDVVWLRMGQHHQLLHMVLEHHGVEAQPTDRDLVSLMLALPWDRAPALVVIDDADRASPEVIDLMARFLTRSPQAARFVLVSNHGVPLPADLADLGVSTGSLRSRDLRFTDEEAEALVLSLTPAVDDDELARIVGEGRGWAAALVGDRRELRQRVLSTEPEQVGNLLLATCDEEFLDAPTAVALTGDQSAGQLIEELAEDGFLVERAGPGPEASYSVHPVLRRALQEGSRPGDTAHVTRAQAHLRGANAPVRDKAGLARVVRHAILAEEPQVLLEILRTHGFSLLEPERLDLLALALGSLAPDLRSTDPSVLVLESLLCRMTLHFESAAALSVDAERAAEEAFVNRAGGGSELALDAIALMRLWRSRCGWADPHLAVAAARERLGCLHSDSSDSHLLAPGRSLALSTWLMGELATVEMRVGDLEAAELHLGEQIFNSRVLHDDRMLATGLAHRSMLELVDGSFQTASSTARSSLGCVEEPLPYVALAHLVAGWGALHELDLEACEEHLARAESQPGIEVDVLVAELLRLLRARLLTEHGLVDEARRLLAQHQSVAQVTPTFLRRLRAIVEAQTAALVNDVATVKDRALTLADLGYPDESEVFHAVAEAGEGLTARALERVGDLLAQPLVDGATAAVAAAVRVGLMLRLGQVECAARRMPDLLARVAPQRLLQILTVGFLGGEAFAELLVRESTRPDGHPFASEALSTLGRYVSSPGRRSPRIQAVAEALKAVTASTEPLDDESGLPSLTPREREVLVELSNGGSYSDIAQALFVSENTVKTHLSSVYRKLGVDRRGDALRLARERLLI